MPFELDTEFKPSGDQPQAIGGLLSGLEAGTARQVLRGVTGSGKTYTMAQVIAGWNRPALIVAPNKVLAAQLYAEFKSLFPRNAVEYFVSYYDYYQPEAYVATSDTYIEKDASVNETLDRLRNAATRSLLEREDVVIVASVSCIYGLGSPDSYRDMGVSISRGGEVDRDDLLRSLARIQYRRNPIDLRPGAMRSRGDVVEVFPAYEDGRALRIELFGDLVEELRWFDPLTGEVLKELDEVTVWPVGHYVTPEDRLRSAVEGIQEELKATLPVLRSEGKLLEAQRLEQRTRYDLEMLREIGFCSGIENYSRHLDGRAAGEPPACLLDYFPEDFVVFLDECHVTLPQVGGMFRGDRSRKQTLVEHGFRLPSALDNRPLRPEEFAALVPRMVYVSATPGPAELEQAGSAVVDQIVRPTGLMDPQVEIRPAEHQVDDLLAELNAVAADGSRALVTTLTKRMAEDLTDYFKGLGVRCRYMHSDIDALERHALIRDLRLGVFDTLIGINLLREGLDLPEVRLVAVLDADKEGFLRSETSLVQTMGRAARNVDGRVILYADRTTRSMQAAMDVTGNRRAVQEAWNRKHGITPQTVKSDIKDALASIYEADYAGVPTVEEEAGDLPLDAAALRAEIVETREAMLDAARQEAFEDAAGLRDRVRFLEEAELERGGTA